MTEKLKNINIYIDFLKDSLKNNNLKYLEILIFINNHFSNENGLNLWEDIFKLKNIFGNNFFEINLLLFLIENNDRKKKMINFINTICYIKMCTKEDSFLFIQNILIYY